jgi:hypothetical protein
MLVIVNSVHQVNYISFNVSKVNAVFSKSCYICFIIIFIPINFFNAMNPGVASLMIGGHEISLFQ